MNPDLIMKLLWLVSVVSLLAFLYWFFAPAAKAQDVYYVSKMPDRQLDITRLLSAVRAVENSCRTDVSRSRARSEYQIKEHTWRQHSTEPFSLASEENPVATIEIQRVARKHIQWIIEELVKRDYTATPGMVGQVWAAGLTKWLEHRQSFEDVQFGTRVGNVYSATQ